MQGLLSDLPLLGVLELIHASQQTGVLDVQSDLPYSVSFVGGEIVGGGILDWQGTEALYCCPLLPVRGSFFFDPRPVQGTPLGPYDHFTTEWARINDEWEQACTYIVSPSRFFTGTALFFDNPGGRSIRSAVRKTQRPALEIAQFVAEAVKARQLQPINRYAWFNLVLQPNTHYGQGHPISEMIDGIHNLGDFIAAGQDVDEVREYLLQVIREGMRFPLCGQVIRDLLWEQQFA